MEYLADFESIISPPAACIAAVDPVAELIQIPLDHTLMEEISSRAVSVLNDGTTFP